MKKLKFILPFIFLAVALTTCKKYPEGGNTWKAASKIKGEYSFVSYTVNGSDSLKYLLDSVLPICKNYIHFDDKIVNRAGDAYVLRFHCDSGETYDNTTWNFLPDAKKIFLDKRKIFTNINIYDTHYPRYKYFWNWDIIKLTKTEMWLKREDNGKTYEMHLIKS